MEFSVYKLLGADVQSTPQEILLKCKQLHSTWTLANVEEKLRSVMSREEATVSARYIHCEGTDYLTSLLSMIMDPSARQCYDAWLDIQQNPTAEKSELTRACLLWYNGNDQASNIKFGQSMFKSLVPSAKKTQKVGPVTNTSTSKPLCRQCRCCFDFEESYLVLHCDCTTRVGHVACMEMFSDQVRGKCPVCRKALLQRHQVSKYLFWNVKEKFKFIS